MIKWSVRILGVVVAALVVLFLIFRTPDTDRQAMRAKYGGEASQFVTLSTGQEVHFRDEGPRDAPPILLLHGSNSSLHTWDQWAGALKDDFRVIRFDQIGHGLTGAAKDRDYSKARFVADVDALADHLGLESFVIAGSSMGGWVSVSYALAHPDRVEGLALLNASGAPRKAGEGRVYLGATIARTPVLNQVMTMITPRSLVQASFEGAVADPSVITEQAVDRYWELLRYPGNRQAAVDRANASRGGPFRPDDVAKLTMPSLIMWGAEDQVTPLSGAEWYAQHLPNDRSIVYDAVAHIPMEEVPTRSVADFEKWLLNLVLTTQETEIPS
ncbi:MAG: alpha/beta hydrolase [Pseudomonadota bacterium]